MSENTKIILLCCVPFIYIKKIKAPQDDTESTRHNKVLMHDQFISKISHHLMCPSCTQSPFHVWFRTQLSMFCYRTAKV